MAELQFLKAPEKQKEILFLFAMVVLYFMLRLPFIATLPLIQDEPLYSIMIQEQIQQKTMLPTLFGHEMPWKPPLFFWTYSMLVPIFENKELFPVLPLEAMYRLPTLFFGLVNLILFYYVMKQMVGKCPELFLSTFIFNVMTFSIYISNTVLIDTFTFTFIFAAMLCYLKKDWPEWRFLAAGGFVFLAFMSKLLLAAVAPVVVIIYFFFNDRKMLFNPLFIISLLAIPLASYSFYSMFENKEMPTSTISIDVFGKLFGYENVLDKVMNSTYFFFYLANIWFALSLFGICKHWKENLVMSIWYAMIIIPLIAASLMPWHFFMIIPPLTYFAAKSLLHEKNKVKLDAFFVIGVCMMLIISIIFTNLFYQDISNTYNVQRDVGNFLAFKKNVVVIGHYAPTIIANKIFTENLKNGSYLDFGWIFFTDDRGTEVAAKEFVLDYNTKKYETFDDDFSLMFWQGGTCRKTTNITKFDYIVIIGKEFENVSVGGEMLYNRSYTRIYRIN